MSYLLNSDYLINVTAGNVPNHRIFAGFGERGGMGTTSTGEDVWRGNDLLSPVLTNSEVIPVPPDIGERMAVVSEDDADNGATATGVLTVRIEYLDASGNEQTEDVTLDGTTAVLTDATNIRYINDIYALTVGSTGVAEGHIKIYSNSLGTQYVYNMIAEGGNKSLVNNRMVPTGY